MKQVQDAANNIKDGIANMNRILVFQDMMDDLIGEDLGELKTSGGVADVAKFKEHLSNKCKDKNPKDLTANRLCFVLSPMSEREFKEKYVEANYDNVANSILLKNGVNGDLDALKQSDRAKYKELTEEINLTVNQEAADESSKYSQKKAVVEAYSGKLENLITGFGEAFILSETNPGAFNPNAPNARQQRRIARDQKIKKYKEMFNSELKMPGFEPEEMLDNTVALDQALTRAVETKQTPLSAVANQAILTQMNISNSVDEYRQCLARRTKKQLDKIPLVTSDNCSFKMSADYCPETNRESCFYDDLYEDALVAALDSQSQGEIEPDLSDPNLPVKIASHVLNNYRQAFNGAVTGSLNRIISGLHGDNEEIEFQQFDVPEEKMRKIDFFAPSEGRDRKISEEYDDLRKTHEKKLDEGLKGTFHAFLTQMDQLDQRNEMATYLAGGDPYRKPSADGQSEKEKTVNSRPKKFFSALQSVGCIDSSRTWENKNKNKNKNENKNEQGFNNMFKDVFDSPDNFKIGVDQPNNGVRHTLKKDKHHIKFKDGFLNDCLEKLADKSGKAKLDDRIDELQRTVKEQKEHIAKIKEDDDYKAKDLVALLAITNYKDKCKSDKRDHGGAFNYNRCTVEYEDGHLKSSPVEVLVSHSGKIINMVNHDEKRNLSTWRTELRKDTRQMKDVCEDESFASAHPEICKRVERPIG